MAGQRRYERHQFRDEDRMEDRQDWTYGHGRRSWQGRDDDERYQRSIYGRGSGASYGDGDAHGESRGRGRDRHFGERLGFEGDDRSPGLAGERTARYGSSHASEAYGPSERRGWRGEAWRREPRYGYGGERDWNEERDVWDRATDEVSSWFGDEEAEHRRRMDKFRGRGPRNYARSEDRIREDVCDRLTEDGAVDATDIEVEVSGTEVTLSGTVPSRDQRRRAEICTERVSGVTHVQNNMRVQGRNDSGFIAAGNS
ncbi:MAG: BON domain-containing protein [Parvibaculaceae bacterium]